FMSTDTRTFKQVENLFFLWKTIGEPGIFEEVPFYDLTFMMSLTTFCSRGRILPDLEAFDLKSLEGYSSISFNGKNFVLHGEGMTDRLANTLSKGEQAIVVMFLGAGMQGDDNGNNRSKSATA